MKYKTLFLLILVGLFSTGCAKYFDLELFNGTVKLKFESRAAKSYRVFSYANEKKGTSFDGLYFDSECELLLCVECDGPVCEPPPINPEIEECE